MSSVVNGVSRLTDYDIHLFKEGLHHRLYDKLGSHLMTVNGATGTYFAVWAPNAEHVYVIGDFNGWNRESHPLGVRWDSSGIWEGFIPGVGHGSIYKYFIISRSGFKGDKGDPFAFRWEEPPKTASVVWDISYTFESKDWPEKRKTHQSLSSPISVYELHLPSWRRVVEEGNRPLTYRELADQLPKYITEMGFTHVEFLPTMEHPFFGSWGYQKVGYFAPSSRYGTPQDFMYLIDALHREGIGVFLDWVPSHFPSDGHGLAYFDGTHLYEHEDPRKGFHPDWKSYIFNYGRNEVRSFLLSSALFWLDKYQADGLRLDAVASMLYLDYSREPGEWIPNKFGGRDNIEAIEFLRDLNKIVYANHPDVQTIAEESTAWPMVSRPVFSGGLGFGMKWNMGWMHDTLVYFTKESVHRKYHQNDLTFNILYAFTENFMLPLSHDEVVHGKGALIGKMPGDDWQKFANLRLLFGYMYGNPGKKLLFMGAEFAQRSEWHHEASLEWHLLQYAPHQGIHQWLKDLNQLYKNEPALYEVDFSQDGFEWVDFQDWEGSVLCFLRKSRGDSERILIICNFTPVLRHNYRVGVPTDGYWKEYLNSDATIYGGGNQGNSGGVTAESIPHHGRPYSINLTVPPLSIMFLKRS